MQATLAPRRSATMTPTHVPANRTAMPAPAALPRRARPAGASDLCRRHRPGKRPVRAGASTLSPATLERLENALIDSLLEAHPNRDRALDRLMRDVCGATVAGGSPTGFPRLHVSAPECTPARLARIEELLVGAVLEGHPKRGKALDRLLHGLAKNDSNPAPAPWPAREPASLERDNDFDGMG